MFTKKVGPSGYTRRDPELHEMDDVMNYVTDEVLMQEVSSEIGFVHDILLEEKMAEYTKAPGGWEWELYQDIYFENNKWYICNKSRQTGGSAMAAAKKTARAWLASNEYKCVMTSYKKEEAINKIDYVRKYLNALPPRYAKKEIRSPRQLIEFENNNGTRSVLMSHAQKPIRGVSGEVFLDELAFYQFAAEIYESALPVVVQFDGDIDIVSTPFGKGGVFYEIFTDKHKYRQYHRQLIMWWHCLRYLKVKDIDYMAKVARIAPQLGGDVEKRVRAFGSDAIITQFESMGDIDSFRQEFEGYFVDESAVFFYRDLIKRVMYHRYSDIMEYDPVETDFIDISAEEALEQEIAPIQKMYEGVLDIYGKPITFKKYWNESDRASECYGSLEDLYKAVYNGEVSENLYAGLDIGTTNHSSHFIIIEEVFLPDGRVLQIERGSKSAHDWKLPDQQDYFERILDDGYLVKMIADGTGIGHQMGQYLSSKFPDIFEDIHMASGGRVSKAEPIMVNLKNRMEAGTLAIEFDRDLMEDLYSIERHISDTKRISYKASEKKRRHSDGAWALAYASWAGTHYLEYTQDLDPKNFALSPRRTNSKLPARFDDSINEEVTLGFDNSPTVFDFESDLGFGLFEGVGAGRFINNWDS